MNNPIKFPARSVTMAMIAIALSGCVSTQDMARTLQNNPDKVMTALAPKTTTIDEEKALGRYSAALLLGAAPLVRNDGLQRHVNRVGRWVALQTGRTDIDWRFGVLDTDNVNAFAAPSGYVLVTRGLLARMETEAELAGVLGHEIAHVLERHYVKAMQKKQQAGAFAEIAADLSGSNTAVTAALNVTRGMYSSGLDKGDEFDADRIGITLATRAGYHPYGLPRVLQMYAASSHEAGFELFFSTHPSPAERLGKLDSILDERFAAAESTGLKQTTAFRQLVAPLKPQKTAGKKK